MECSCLPLLFVSFTALVICHLLFFCSLLFSTHARASSCSGWQPPEVLLAHLCLFPRTSIRSYAPTTSTARRATRSRTRITPPFLPPSLLLTEKTFLISFNPQPWSGNAFRGLSNLSAVLLSV